jgi:ADP-heptose:LPS heptosyltransferase
MAIPAVRAFRDGFPGVELWCVGPWVDAVLEAEPGIGRRLVEPRAWRGRLNLVRELRAAALDLVVLLPNSFKAAVFGWLTGAP